MNQLEDGEVPTNNEPKKNGASIYSSTYRTKVCEHFKKGSCIKGNKCSYMHPKELQNVTRICKYYLGQGCQNQQQCQYSHDLSKYQCKFFFAMSNCKGQNCRFSHDLWENEIAKQQWAADNDQFLKDCYQRRGTTGLGAAYDEQYKMKVFEQQKVNSNQRNYPFYQNNYMAPQPQMQINILQQISPQIPQGRTKLPINNDLDPISDEEQQEEINKQPKLNIYEQQNPYQILQNNIAPLPQHQPFSINTQYIQQRIPINQQNQFLYPPPVLPNQQQQQMFQQQQQAYQQMKYYQQQTQNTMFLNQYHPQQTYQIQQQQPLIEDQKEQILQQQQIIQQQKQQQLQQLQQQQQIQQQHQQQQQFLQQQQSQPLQQQSQSQPQQSQPVQQQSQPQQQQQQPQQQSIPQQQQQQQQQFEQQSNNGKQENKEKNESKQQQQKKSQEKQQKKKIKKQKSSKQNNKKKRETIKQIKDRLKKQKSKIKTIQIPPELPSESFKVGPISKHLGISIRKPVLQYFLGF